LRRIEYPDRGTCELKLTQKVPADRPGYVQGLITNTCLSAAEYDLLASLPADVLTKTRLSVPPLNIDICEPPLHGLVMADAEIILSAQSREACGGGSDPASFGWRGEECHSFGWCLVFKGKHQRKERSCECSSRERRGRWGGIWFLGWSRRVTR
jgi:hypothetical protein